MKIKTIALSLFILIVADSQSVLAHSKRKHHKKRNAVSVSGTRVTEYYSMVNTNLRRSDCKGEGNQIVNGQLYGSNCRPVKKYCRYGVGSKDNCLTPCVDAAGGGSYSFGTIVTLKRPRVCRWGPYAGRTIYKVRIADVGGDVNGTDIDVFQGLCRRKENGVCREFSSSTMMARYDGKPGDPKDSTYTRFAQKFDQINGQNTEAVR